MNPITQGESGSFGNRIHKQEHPIPTGSTLKSALQGPNFEKRIYCRFHLLRQNSHRNKSTGMPGFQT